MVRARFSVAAPAFWLVRWQVVEGAPHVLAGRFRIESTLASGGMGTVYVAVDTAIGRRVAIKMLRAEVAVEQDSVERLREEAFTLANLHHPNIVQLFDFHAGGPDSTFLVMELVPGETLAAVLQRLGGAPFPIEPAIDYGRQLLSAVAAAHSSGIVHRDIKPANLLIVSLPARRELIKVLDFGIAKLAEAVRRRPATAGMLIGTPSYMAPEQAQGGAVDARTDVYAVGLVLYRLLSGVNPFEGFELRTTLDRVMHFAPEDLSRIRPEVPPGIVAAVMRALSKNPADRFASAVDFAAALGLGELTVRAASFAPEPMAPMPSMGGAGLAFLNQGPHAAPTIARGPSGFMMGIVVALAAVTILGLGGAVAWLLSTRQASRVVDSVDAAVASSAASVAPSATSSALPSAVASTVSSGSTAASTTKKPHETPAPSSSVGTLGGKCACLPNRGTRAHGNNMRLAPRPTPLECACDFEGSTLCTHAFVPCPPNTPGSQCAPCKEKWSVGILGASCTGFDFESKSRTGVAKDCQYPASVVEYAGPPGRPCKGLAVDGQMLDGAVFCPRSSR